MQYNHILIRYGELALKGRNRDQFEKQLQGNVAKVLRDFPQVRIVRIYGRMYLELHGAPYEEVAGRLSRVFGISSFSPTLKVGLDIDAIKEAALQAMRDAAPKTFKVSVKRPNKQFPYRSAEITQMLGAYIMRAIDGLKVDVHQPEVELVVEIRHEGVFINCARVSGSGGLPVGSSGKAMLMLSGGIDSPVAGWMTMKRGVRIEGVHFASPPYTSERALNKVRDLARVLSGYGGDFKLHVVPFTEIQMEIRKNCPEEYLITIMRRFMMRIAQRLAEKNGALAIATGESLGQVASQTMESMNTINKVADIPVIRPLVALDKVEIIEMARRIGTYDISILPYEDCCTIFVPKAPVTRPKPEAAARHETKLDVEALVADALARTQTEWLSAAQKEETFDFL